MNINDASKNLIQNTKSAAKKVAAIQGTDLDPSTAMHKAASGSGDGGDSNTANSLLNQSSSQKENAKKAAKMFKDFQNKQMETFSAEGSKKLGLFLRFVKMIGAYIVPILIIMLIFLVLYILISYISSSLLFNPSTRQDEEAAEKDIGVGVYVTDQYDKVFFRAEGMTAKEKAIADEENKSVEETLMKVKDSGDEEYDIDLAERYDIKMQYTKIGRIFKKLMDKSIANTNQKFNQRVAEILRKGNPYYEDVYNGWGKYDYYERHDFFNGKDIHGKTRWDYVTPPTCPPLNPDFITRLEDNSEKIYTQIPRAIAGYSVSRMDVPPWEGYFWDIKGATFFQDLNDELYRYEDEVLNAQKKDNFGNADSKKMVQRNRQLTCGDPPVKVYYTEFHLNQAKIEEGNMERLFDCFFRTGYGTYYISKPQKGSYFKNIEKMGGYYYNISPGDERPYSKSKEEGSVKYHLYYPNEAQYKRDSDLSPDQRDPTIKKKSSLISLLSRFFGKNQDPKKQHGFSRAEKNEEKFIYGKPPEDVHFDGNNIYTIGKGSYASGDLLGYNTKDAKSLADFENLYIGSATEKGANIAKLALEIVIESNKYGLVGRYHQPLRYMWKNRDGKAYPNLINQCRGKDGNSPKCKLKYFDCSSFAGYVFACYTGIDLGASTYFMALNATEGNTFDGRITYIPLKRTGRYSSKSNKDYVMEQIRRFGAPGDVVVSRGGGGGHAVVLVKPDAKGEEIMYVESNTQNKKVENLEAWNCKNGKNKEHGMYMISAREARENFGASYARKYFYLIHLNR